MGHSPEFLAHPAAEAEAGPLCAICQTAIAPGETIGPCPACASTFHQECWAENGGCAVYGCERAPRTVKDENPSFAPASYWGQDEKDCPHCAKRIKVAAVRCRFCGTSFESAAPMSPRELQAKRSAAPAKESLKSTTVTLFVCGLIPCLSPFAALLGGIWYLRHRSEIRELPSANRAFCLVGLATSVVSTAILLLVWILH